MPILTFVTPQPQPDFDLWIKKSHPDVIIDDRQILDDRAIQWHIPKSLDKNIIDDIRMAFKIDIFQTSGTPIKLFMADMDSTIIQGETLDDMAALAGVGDKIATITALAMRGELDFETALTERIQLLASQSTDLIERALHSTHINKGADILVNHLKSKGIYCVLVSGGFTQFTAHVAEKLGFDAHFGNEFIIENGQLTGDVTRPILDKDFKLKKLHDYQLSMELSPDNIMAIGDGANDLPMLYESGIGVAYHGKPLLRDALINQINYSDLSSLIYLI